MTPAKNRSLLELRRLLADRLSRSVLNKEVEEKELAAFDLIINRRQVLKTAVALTTLETLVDGSLVPTAWGQRDERLRVDPKEVGLTQGDMDAVTAATQVNYGTELFQDTIYSTPVVSKTAVGSHDLIEGARSRMRVQSQLGAEAPLESTFLDRGFHFGPSELVQIEEDDQGQPMIVHYYHPWGARTDGGRADGLKRRVILQRHHGLTAPTKILCITGSHTNEFIEGSNDVTVGASFLIYVEQNHGHDDGFIILGSSRAPVRAGVAALERGDYPIRWHHAKTSNLNLPPGTTNYRSAEKFVNAGFATSGEYDPTLATEHIVIYQNNHMKVISLDDVTTPGRPILIVTTVPHPADVSTPRLTHIQYEPEVGGVSPMQLSDFAFTSTSTSESSVIFATYTGDSKDATIIGGGYKHFAGGLSWLDVSYPNVYQESLTPPLPASTDRPDYTTLTNVHGLIAAPVEGSTGTVHLKIGNFPGTADTADRALCLFAMVRQTDEFGNLLYVLAGDFPLAVPDDAGIGKITNVGGGISKFGGLRLFASDADGNVFMLRQQRLASDTEIYAPPIYIQYDSEGNPVTFSSTARMALPSQVAPSSNLQSFPEWMSFFPAGPEFTVGYNMLLNAALGLGTDATNVVQATWLGNSYQTVYAPKRFAHDGEHVVVRKVSTGTEDVFNVLNVFNTPVEKTWRSRLIASQTEPAGPGMQETGDFYQATITPANAYGQSASLNSPANARVAIEVRADAPVTVVDQTNNYYYDIDRYTSFIAVPDASSGSLRVAVKAENFSQVLYARLLHVSDMQPSSDPAMLDGGATGGDAATDWVSINIASNAQQRMSNTATPGSVGIGSGPVVYISSETLGDSNEETTWQTKGSYHPTQGNLDSLASYLNQSGSNLAQATGALTKSLLGGDVSIDPLTSTTPLVADSTQSAMTTTFDYRSGTVTVCAPGDCPPSPPGDVFSSLGHALHDALHWLQHVEGEVYQSLSNGVSIAIDETESITVTVSADIMKQVNGVDAALEQAVSTVEEYGAIVVNVVVTIVEASWLYQFVKLLITLISLFIHLADIKKLRTSLQSTFAGLADPRPAIPLPPIDTAFDWDTNLSPYVGPGNKICSTAQTANTNSTEDEFVKGILSALVGNPFANKLLDDVISAVSRVIGSVSNSPIRFNLDNAIAEDLLDLTTSLEGDVVQLIENVTTDTLNAVTDQVISDVEDPKETFSNLASGLEQLLGELETNAMTAIYSALKQLVATDQRIISQLLEQDDLVTLEIPLLADLFKLFDIGTTSGNKVKLSASDAIFFPMAMIVWTGVFMSSGSSIKKIEDLNQGTSLVGGGLGDSKPNYAAFANLSAATVLMGASGGLWWAGKVNNPTDDDSGLVAYLPELSNYANLLHWVTSMTLVSAQYSWGEPTVLTIYAPIFNYCRLVTAVGSFVALLPGQNNNVGNPKSTDILLLLNSFLNLGAITFSIIDAVEDGVSDEGWGILIGTDVARGAVYAKLMFFLGVKSPNTLGVLATVLPIVGFGTAAVSTGVKEDIL